MSKNLFIKGQSGNPSGKPKGTRHKATEITYALMEGNLKEVLEVVLEKAKAGDMMACRMIIDKILPNSKDRSIALDLPSINDLEGVGRAQEKILKDISIGVITPNEGERISSIIEMRRRYFETNDLETRISHLEALK